MGLPMKRFKLKAALWETDVTWIVDLFPLLECWNDKHDEDNETSNLLDLGGAKGNVPIGMKQK